MCGPGLCADRPGAGAGRLSSGGGLVASPSHAADPDGLAGARRCAGAYPPDQPTAIYVNRIGVRRIQTAACARSAFGAIPPLGSVVGGQPCRPIAALAWVCTCAIATRASLLQGWGASVFCRRPALWSIDPESSHRGGAPLLHRQVKAYPNGIVPNMERTWLWCSAKTCPIFCSSSRSSLLGCSCFSI